MKSHRFAVVLLIIVLTQVLQGCVTNYPSDLKFEGLSLVNRQQNGTLRFTPFQASINSKYLYLKLDIVSKEDIWAFSKSNNYTVGIHSYLCDNKGLKILMGANQIYWKDINISEKFYLDSPILPDGSGNILYSIYLKVDSPATSSFRNKFKGSNKNEYEAYNLLERAENICVEIIGQSMVGGFKSNIVKVHKNMVQSKLKDLKE